MKLLLWDGSLKTEDWKEAELPEDMHRYADYTLFSNSCSYREDLGRLQRCEFSDPRLLVEKIDSCNTVAGCEEFGAFLDMGICYLLGQDVHEVIDILGISTKAIMVRENDGIHNRTFMPFTGPHLDYDRLIRQLRKYRFDGTLILDVSMIRQFDSLQMRKLLENTVRKMGQYLLWQIQIEPTLAKYDKRVLFGAGQMCKNYMNFYGKKYPVLFTCDNNPQRWGEIYEGIEVKNPEALKELPEDCAIFLCNMYYEEIEQQLRDMGIRNPIEKFSDEILPEEPLT